MKDAVEFVESGIAGLDTVLRGGLPRNQMYAIYGISGSGKTTLCMQFLLHGVHLQERALYICTSETEVEIERISRSHGWSLDGIKVVHLSMAFGEKGGAGQTMLFPVEVELPQVVDKLINIIKDCNPQRVVIDSLSEIRLLSKEKSWYQRQILMIKQFLEPRNCTAFLTDTVGEDNTVLKTIVHGVVEMTRSNPLYGPERRRLRIEKLRGHQFISGYHDYDIVRGGVKVFPRLISYEHRRKYPKESVSSGVDELDRLLGGGLDRGTCTLLQGASGTGKSALASKFAVSAAQRNEKSIIYCFDERISTFIQRTQSLGMDIQRYLANGTITLNQVDPAELSAGEFSSTVIETVIEKDVSLIIVDSLNGYAYALPDERFLSVHLHELSSFLNVQGVVTLFTMSQQSVFGVNVMPSPFNVSYVADTVLNICYFEHHGEVHKAISVLKRRNGNHERTIRELTMDTDGLHVGLVLQEFEGVTTGNLRFVGNK